MSAYPCGCDPTHQGRPYFCSWHQTEWDRELQELLSQVTIQPVGQTKKQSLIESLSNVAVGFLIALATQIIIYPLMGVQLSMSVNVLATSIFTVVSIVRSYCVRRMFNRIHR